LYLGKVIGTTVSTVRLERYHGFKLMLVQPIRPDGTPCQRPLVCVDTVDAGEGDTIMYMDDPDSAGKLVGMPEGGPVRAVIVGILDELHWRDSQGNMQVRNPQQT